MKFKIIYMGTPLFAREILDYLLTRDDLEIVGVVTQPDRIVGRKKILTYSQVKELALDHNLRLFQPEKVIDSLAELAELEADAIITCAYGQFLPSSILNLTRIGVINVHASLLPKYRGGAPMQYALRNGDKVTGITLMKSALKMDAGDIFSQIETTISNLDTLGTLELKLIDSAIEILKRDLLSILDGTMEAKVQNHDEATFSPTIKREDELINLEEEGESIYNQIRSLIPNPYAYAYIGGKKVKFCAVSFEYSMHREAIGKIVEFTKDNLLIALKNGILRVTQLQIEGKPVMTTQQVHPGYSASWKDLIVMDHV